MFSDGLKIILQQKTAFVTSEAWARHLKAFSEGRKSLEPTYRKTD